MSIDPVNFYDVVKLTFQLFFSVGSRFVFS